LARLEGKVAVITGAGRGIGRATAVRFGREGAAVVINDVDAEPAEETAALVKETGSEALVSTDDTTSLDQARRLMDSAAERFDKIDIVVNNAGITRDKTFHNLDDELWDFVLDTNLKTAFHSTLAAMPYLREVAERETSEQGQPAYHRKVNLTTSVAALVGNVGQATTPPPRGASPPSPRPWPGSWGRSGSTSTPWPRGSSRLGSPRPSRRARTSGSPSRSARWR
jgi:3-oxoacyl-[acyl-carrier protein] reductase